MYALTIWQPWASLIIAGAKPYEFRGWRPYPRMQDIDAWAEPMPMRGAQGLWTWPTPEMAGL